MADRILSTYLSLERLMLQLDSRSDPAADVIRDAMDPLWHALSADERESLNSRPSIGGSPPSSSVSLSDVIHPMSGSPQPADTAGVEHREPVDVPLDEVATLVGAD